VSERGAAVLAISGDSPACHAAFAAANKFPFPLLSDLHRAAIRAYGALDADRNVAWRSTFVIDRDGVLRWGQAGDRVDPPRGGATRAAVAGIGRARPTHHLWREGGRRHATRRHPVLALR